jgi:hypothetical protein
VLIVSHVARHEPRAKITKRKPFNPTPRRVRRHRGDTTPAVTRLVDSSGAVSFAGANYRVGKGFARRSVQVAIVDGQIEIRCDSELIRTHTIHHDRTKEHGALATPTGRPRKTTAAA